MKDWFKARNIWGAAIQALSDAEAGRLMKALWKYTMTGEQQNLSGSEKAIFALILMTLSQDEEQVNDLSRKRADAGSLGGRQKVANQANATFATTEEANQANATFATTEEATQANASNKNKNKEKEKEKEKEYMFDRFWAAYPRHENKPAARKAFAKADPDEELLLTMLTAIEKQKSSSQWQENGGQYIPHPATWLNGRRWEDEVQPRRAIASVNAQRYSQRDYSDEDEEATARMLAMMHGGQAG